MKNGSKILCMILVALLVVCTTDVTAKPKQTKVRVMKWELFQKQTALFPLIIG